MLTKSMRRQLASGLKDLPVVAKHFRQCERCDHTFYPGDINTIVCPECGFAHVMPFTKAPLELIAKLKEISRNEKEMRATIIWPQTRTVIAI